MFVDRSLGRGDGGKRNGLRSYDAHYRDGAWPVFVCVCWMRGACVTHVRSGRRVNGVTTVRVCVVVSSSLDSGSTTRKLVAEKPPPFESSRVSVSSIRECTCAVIALIVSSLRRRRASTRNNGFHAYGIMTRYAERWLKTGYSGGFGGPVETMPTPRRYGGDQWGTLESKG